MWTAANSFFDAPESSFPVCHKDKGTSKVYISWISKPVLTNKTVIILDTVIATGDTVNALCNKIHKMYPAHDYQLKVISCYASPQSVKLLLANTAVNELIAGVISITVDQQGYLIPATNGDMGDKLFGNKNVDHMGDFETDTIRTLCKALGD
jgi:uracil phosphoribosyltransferase